MVDSSSSSLEIITTLDQEYSICAANCQSECPSAQAICEACCETISMVIEPESCKIPCNKAENGEKEAIEAAREATTLEMIVKRAT